MKALYKIASALALTAVLFSSCEQKEVLLTPLAQPSNATYESDFGSITFTWDEVKDAGQYQYIVMNPLKYTVAKGLTAETTVTVKSLSPATTYTIRIKAIPSGDGASSMSASGYYEFEASTAAPKEYDFAWSFPATIWWDYDNHVHESSKATFGQLNGTGEYVLAAWGGVIGMDIVFSLDENGEWLINYENSTAYGGGPDANMAVALFHGIGGTSAANCWFYTNNTGSSFEGDSTGGHGEAWMYNPDGDWTGYYFTYGDDSGSGGEDEPEEEVVAADPAESFIYEGEVSFDGEPLGTASVSFDDATGTFAVYGWWGVEGYDVVFTRDADTGVWVLDTENSSAFLEGPDADGYIDLGHGLSGKGMYTSVLFPESGEGSGFSGTADKGTLYAVLYGPDRTEGTWEISWSAMSSFMASGPIYTNDEEVGTATVIYDAENKVWTVRSWYGVDGYDIAFTLNDDGTWNLLIDESSAYVSGPDANGAIGLNSGIEGANTCWFYPSGNYGWVEGNPNEGNLGCWMYNHETVWTYYEVDWKAGNWTAVGDVSFGEGDDNYPLGTATLSYDADTDTYTLYGWYGVPGYDIVFKVKDSGEWDIDYENTSAYVTGPDDNNAVGLYHGLEDAASGNCWFYTSDGYSYFEGNAAGGHMESWMWNHNSEWGPYYFDWSM